MATASRFEDESKAEWLKNYSKVIVCSVCGHIYGSDLKKDTRICVGCSRKLVHGELKVKK